MLESEPGEGAEYEPAQDRRTAGAVGLQDPQRDALVRCPVDGEVHDLVLVLADLAQHAEAVDLPLRVQAEVDAAGADQAVAQSKGAHAGFGATRGDGVHARSDRLAARQAAGLGGPRA